MRSVGTICAGLLLLCIGAGTFSSPESATYDIVIRNARIIDGTGNPSFAGDLAIKAGRIAARGQVAGLGREELNAQGMVVAPGFIDVHTHADELAEQPLAENFVRMGVTTIIAGNCGGSALDIHKLFARIEATNPAVNFATLIGHNTVRSEAMGGDFDRAPTAAEMQKMKALVEQAMKDGALGLSTGLIYVPGVFSKTDEIVELAKVIAPFHGIYTSHMRYEDASIFDALNELFTVARAAGVRAEVSHIKLSGPAAWGKAADVLACIERARSEGLDITQDQYAYTASSTGISQLIPETAREGGKQAFLKRLADPAQRGAIKKEMAGMLKRKGRSDYGYAVIASYSADPRLNGKNIIEAASALRGSSTLEDQLETVLEIQKNGGASGVFHGMSEEDLQTFMRHPNTMVACDSGLREFGVGVPHPRGYGNNARVLSRYVRDLKVLRIEDAIRRMTSLPANTFDLKGRGLLIEGNWADVVVFDPAKIRDTATFDSPHHYPEGIHYVIVNGRIVLRDGHHTRANTGRCLRKGSDDPSKYDLPQASRVSAEANR